MTKYFFSISKIRNLVGLHGILSLINADGWNVAMDPRKLQVIHQNPPLEGSGNQTTLPAPSNLWGNWVIKILTYAHHHSQVPTFCGTMIMARKGGAWEGG